MNPIPPRLAALLLTIDAEIAHEQRKSDEHLAAASAYRQEREQLIAPYASPSPADDIDDVADNDIDVARSRCWAHRPRRGAEMDGPPVPRTARRRESSGGFVEERYYPGNGYRTQAGRLGIGRGDEKGGVWLTRGELDRMAPAVAAK